MDIKLLIELPKILFPRTGDLIDITRSANTLTVYEQELASAQFDKFDSEKKGELHKTEIQSLSH